MFSGPCSQAHSNGGTTSTALLLTRSKLPDVCDATIVYKCTAAGLQLPVCCREYAYFSHMLKLPCGTSHMHTHAASVCWDMHQTATSLSGQALAPQVQSV